MLQSWCRKQKNPMWPFSNLNKIFPCAHSQLQTCNSYELFLLPFYFMYFIPKAETGLETKLQTPVSFINLAASLQSELLLLFLTVYHLKAREYCFYCYCENKSREKNNLELPFSSQSNIMGKKNRGRMSDTQRFFFFELSTGAQAGAAGYRAWILSMGCTGLIWKDSRCLNNEPRLPLHLGYKSHRCVYKKQDNQQNILPQAPKKLQPLVIHFSLTLHRLFIAQEVEPGGERKGKKKIRFHTHFHAEVTHVQRGRGGQSDAWLILFLHL